MYWAARRDGARDTQGIGSGGGGESDDVAVVQSDYGVERAVDRVTLAKSVVDAVPRDVVAARFAYIGVADGAAGTIMITTVRHAVGRADAGQWPCALCGAFVSVGTQGVEWHMKNVHGTTRHADAYTAAVAAQQALVLWRPGPLASAAGSDAGEPDSVARATVGDDGTHLRQPFASQPPSTSAIAPSRTSVGEQSNAALGGNAPRRLITRDMTSAQSDPGWHVPSRLSLGEG